METSTFGKIDYRACDLGLRPDSSWTGPGTASRRALDLSRSIDGSTRINRDDDDPGEGRPELRNRRLLA